jgi:hypothetical protein
MKKKGVDSIHPVVMDGNLEKAEALSALSKASCAATAALPEALARCKTPAQKQKVMADRDICQLAYLNSLAKSLVQTGPLFEQMADDLGKAAIDVQARLKELKDPVAVSNLLVDVARLASSLALAFA